MTLAELIRRVREIAQTGEMKMKMSKPRTIQLVNGDFLSTIKKNGKIFVGGALDSAGAESNAREQVETYFKKDKSHRDFHPGQVVKLGVEKYTIVDTGLKFLNLVLLEEESTEPASDDGPEING